MSPLSPAHHHTFTPPLHSPALPLLGLLAFAAYALLAWAARSGPVAWPLYFVVWAVGWGTFALAWRHTRTALPTARAVWFGFIAFRLAGLAGMPVFEDDFYRYLWDGWMTRVHGSPYGVAPDAFFADADVPEPMQRVLDGVNHPGLPTLYGPVLQSAFWLAALVQPGALWPLKLLLLVAEAALVAAVLRLGGPRAALLCAWCPLAILEVAFNAHPEPLGLAALAWAWHAHTRGRNTQAAVLLGLAAAARPFALVLAPFLLRRAGWRGVAWCGATLAAAYLPFFARGGGVMEVSSLAQFAGGWEFNSTGFALLRSLAGDTAGRALAVLTLLALLAWWWRRSSADQPPRPERLLLALLVCAPVANPWYAVWLTPFAALRAAWWPWAACAAVTLAHLHGLTVPAFGLAPYEHPVWLRPLEVALVLAAWRCDAERRGDAERE